MQYNRTCRKQVRKLQTAGCADLLSSLHLRCFWRKRTSCCTRLLLHLEDKLAPQASCEAFDLSYWKPWRLLLPMILFSEARVVLLAGRDSWLQAG